MGKLLLRLLVVVALLSSLASSRVHAASITLSVDPAKELVIDNQTSLDVGSVAVLTTGATAFAFNAALPGLSVLNSIFGDSGTPPYGFLIANNTADGVALVPAGSQALLGTFQIPVPSAFGIFSGDELLGGTVFDPFGNPLVPVSVNSYRPVCDPGPCPQLPYYFVMTFVPEPAGVGLAALAILGLGVLVSTRRMV